MRLVVRGDLLAEGLMMMMSKCSLISTCMAGFETSMEEPVIGVLSYMRNFQRF